MFKTILTLMLLLPLPLLAATPEEPAEIVTQRTEAVLNAITERQKEFKTHPERLREFVRGQLNDVMDRPYTARLVLARHARKASEEEILAFADALTDSLLRRYAEALVDIDPGLEVRIASSTPLRGGQIIRVASRIVRKAGEPVEVDYLFRQNDDQWQVFDVIVEGISYVQTYRNQFDDLLRKKSLEEVIESLRSGELEVEAAG